MSKVYVGPEARNEECSPGNHGDDPQSAFCHNCHPELGKIQQTITCRLLTHHERQLMKLFTLRCCLASCVFEATHAVVVERTLPGGMVVTSFQQALCAYHAQMLSPEKVPTWDVAVT